MKIYLGLTLRTFREEELAEQFGYFKFSLYLIIFILGRNSKKNRPVLIESKILTKEITCDKIMKAVYFKRPYLVFVLPSRFCFAN